MTPTTPDFTTITTAGNLAFVLRLMWDEASGQWRILLKPINGQEPRLFGTVEAALVYLETVMAQERARPT